MQRPATDLVSHKMREDIDGKLPQYQACLNGHQRCFEEDLREIILNDFHNVNDHLPS